MVAGHRTRSARRRLDHRLLSALVQEFAYLGQAGAGGLQVRVQGQGALEAPKRLLRAAQVVQRCANVGVGLSDALQTPEPIRRPVCDRIKSRRPTRVAQDPGPGVGPRAHSEEPLWTAELVQRDATLEWVNAPTCGMMSNTVR